MSFTSSYRRAPGARLCILLASASFTALVASGDELRAQGQDATPRQVVETQLSSHVRAGLELAQFVEASRRVVFWTRDHDADGKVSASDIEHQRMQRAADHRANVISARLRYDADGDSVVTREEIVRAETQSARSQARSSRLSEESARRQIETVVAGHMRADGNGDGRMELREILEFARTQPLPGSPPEIAFRPVLSLDENGDGATDNAEFDRAAERMFRSVDTDRDGLLSPQEADAFRTRNNGGGTARSDAANRRAEQSLARARAGCAMPPASEGAKVVLFSAYEGEALSTTTIGSQDVAVGTATITIEPGREPIYLVVAVGEATIWRVSGAVGRLERLVLTSNKTRPRGATPDERPLVGATGVAAGKVTFLERTGCVRPFTEAPSSASASAVGVVMRETGKRPDVIAAQYGVAGFSIPSGQVSSQRPAGGGPIIVVQREGSLTIKGDTKNVIVETGGMGTLERELLRFSPGGVVTINAADVVASAPAEPYVVLPQQAGLIQLVQSGALRQTRNGEFLITRKIRMPAELNGAHQAKFVLLRGVPEPDGDFGHSTVISEETGQQLNSRMPR